MRRAGAVSVSGALLLALLCIASILLLPNPVGAQQGDDPNDPLDGEEVTLLDTDADDIANRVLIGGITNCTISADATVTVQRNDDTGEPAGEPVSLANQAPVRITQAGTEIVIDRTDLGNLNENLGRGVGVVTESSGITCDAANPATPTAPACPAGTEVVVRFTSDDTLKPFRIDEEDFQVRYAVEAEQETETENESFELSVRRGGDTVESAEETEFPVTDGLLKVDDEGPGTFRLEVDSVDVVFAITVCEGEAGGGGGNGNGDGNDNGGDGNNNNDDGDVDDPDDVVPGTGDDDPLPDTGGAPLLFGAAALALAAALLARRVLAP